MRGLVPRHGAQRGNEGESPLTSIPPPRMSDLPRQHQRNTRPSPATDKRTSSSLVPATRTINFLPPVLLPLSATRSSKPSRESFSPPASRLWKQTRAESGRWGWDCGPSAPPVRHADCFSLPFPFALLLLPPTTLDNDERTHTRNVPPAPCLPTQRARSGGPPRHCLLDAGRERRRCDSCASSLVRR